MTWKLYAPNDKSGDAWVVDEAGNFVAVGLNVRLIAAAPDLLQALQWLVCEADEDMPSEHRSDSFTSALDAAIAAIAKAKETDQ